MTKFIRQTSSGMTMLELAAAIVVVSIIAIGMTSGAQAVMLHYQSDTVRQDLRQYGNNIMREITRELNLAQKVEIDGQNGFSRIKLYKYFTDISPKLTISCQSETGIYFNNEVPLEGVLDFPRQGVFRGPNTRNVFVDDLWKYNKNNTYMDIGSVFDPYVGRRSRGYMRDHNINKLEKI